MYWYLGGDTGTVSEMESMLQQEEAHVDAGEACLHTIRIIPTIDSTLDLRDSSILFCFSICMKSKSISIANLTTACTCIVNMANVA